MKKKRPAPKPPRDDGRKPTVALGLRRATIVFDDMPPGRHEITVTFAPDRPTKR